MDHTAILAIDPSITYNLLQSRVSSPSSQHNSVKAALILSEDVLVIMYRVAHARWGGSMIPRLKRDQK